MGASSERDKEQGILSAQQVLDKLIQAFALKPPELTTDPLGFFANYLSRSLLQDIIEKRESDIYFIDSVIERIRQAQQREARTIQKIEPELERVRDALR